MAVERAKGTNEAYRGGASTEYNHIMHGRRLASEPREEKPAGSAGWCLRRAAGRRRRLANRNVLP
jgi:hypothetical protein